MNRLPLSQIAAFEAAARHLSFTRAAAELNVQQPAVSRQVAALELEAGTPLFLRTKPRLTLTEEGGVLFNAVTSGFGDIRSALDRIRPRHQPANIVVNAAIGFTSLFMLPRLAEFQSLYPGIRLQIVTRDQNPDFDTADCDIVVTFGTRGVEGCEQSLIFYEELVPICRPGYLPDNRPVDLTDLGQQNLLHMSNQSHGDDWLIYFQGTGISVPQPDSIDRVFSYMVYLRAIQNGLGIGLGWRRLIEDMVESGALSIACERTVQTERGYHCSITPRAASRAEAMAFLDWIGRLV